MKNKILVVEDEQAISDLICMNLEAAGYEAMTAFDGLTAERMAEEMKGIDLALVDVMLPGKDGFSLMETMKSQEIPVIYLTAKSDVTSKVFGLKQGAEDYIVKPFEVLELLVRIEKVLDRTGKNQKRLTVRGVDIDLDGHRVFLDGDEVMLKPMEYDLLVFLIKNRNVAFSRDQLLNRIWGDLYVGETRTVDVHIRQLRKKLRLEDVIITIPKMGYRLEDYG